MYSATAHRLLFGGTPSLDKDGKPCWSRPKFSTNTSSTSHYNTNQQPTAAAYAPPPPSYGASQPYPPTGAQAQIGGTRSPSVYSRDVSELVPGKGPLSRGKSKSGSKGGERMSLAKSGMPELVGSLGKSRVATLREDERAGRGSRSSSKGVNSPLREHVLSQGSMKVPGMEERGLGSPPVSSGSSLRHGGSSSGESIRSRGSRHWKRSSGSHDDSHRSRYPHGGSNDHPGGSNGRTRAESLAGSLSSPHRSRMSGTSSRGNAGTARTKSDREIEDMMRKMNVKREV